MRDKNKAKERKLSGDDDDGAGVAVLGEASDDDDASSDSGRSGRDGGGSRSDDDSDSDDSDSDSDSSDRPQKRAKTDVSVAGMALKSETVESMEERAMRLLEGKSTEVDGASYFSSRQSEFRYFKRLRSHRSPGSRPAKCTARSLGRPAA